MTRQGRRIVTILAILALPLAGYGIMHAVTYIFPFDAQTGISGVIYTVLLLALGLLIPWGMLKLGAHVAHLNNPREKELDIRDIAKDKNEIAQEYR